MELTISDIDLKAPPPRPPQKTQTKTQQLQQRTKTKHKNLWNTSKVSAVSRIRRVCVFTWGKFGCKFVCSYSCYPAVLCTWWSLWGAPSGQADPRTHPAPVQHSHYCTSPPLCSGRPCSKVPRPCVGSSAETKITQTLNCLYYALKVCKCPHPNFFLLCERLYNPPRGELKSPFASKDVNAHELWAECTVRKLWLLVGLKQKPESYFNHC